MLLARQLEEVRHLHGIGKQGDPAGSGDQGIDGPAKGTGVGGKGPPIDGHLEHLGSPFLEFFQKRSIGRPILLNGHGQSEKIGAAFAGIHDLQKFPPGIGLGHGNDRGQPHRPQGCDRLGTASDQRGSGQSSKQIPLPVTRLQHLHQGTGAYPGHEDGHRDLALEEPFSKPDGANVLFQRGLRHGWSQLGQSMMSGDQLGHFPGEAAFEGNHPMTLEPCSHWIDSTHGPNRSRKEPPFTVPPAPNSHRGTKRKG